MLVEIEGFDEIGKTTLVKQLRDKYKIATMAFPTEEYKEKLVKQYKKFTSQKTLKSLLDYHMLFLEDFIKNDAKIKKLSGKKLLVLDRYIYSHAAYANTEIGLYFINKYKDRYYKYTKDIMNTFYSFYSNLTCPDLVIFLERSPQQNCPEEMRHNYFYGLNFKNYAPKRVVNVRALRADTFARVENILHNQGYL
jgi:thymidylate kinase